jgi:RNA polymerase sigma factor (sigma-70 family)
MSLIPQARTRIKLSTEALVARSPVEWRKAVALAKSFAIRWVKALGSDVDDLVQDALQHLDHQLPSITPSTPPESVLLQYFACRARNAVRDLATRRRLLERGAIDLSPEAARSPEDLVDDKRWAAAFEAAVQAERLECDAADAVLLDNALMGASLSEMASVLGTPKTTVHTRLGGLRARLRDRIIRNLSQSAQPAHILRGKT